MRHRHTITDADWERIKDFLPGRPGFHGKAARDRQLDPLAAVEDFQGRLGVVVVKQKRCDTGQLRGDLSVRAGEQFIERALRAAHRWLPPISRSTRPQPFQTQFRLSPEQGPQTFLPASRTPTSGRDSPQLAHGAGLRRRCR